MKPNPVGVLLDNSIISGAEHAESVTMEKEVLWGKIQQLMKIHGYRKKSSNDVALQKEIDALFTIGRLIREGVVAAYTYNELKFEAFRRSSPISAFYALKDCKISICLSPIERSKFRQTIDFTDYVSKGGKKDKRRNLDISDFNQIPFIEWLLRLDESGIQMILSHSKDIGLTKFEVESFTHIEWFRFICNRFGSAENYPDAFHLWTAERNNIDVFLTLEKSLPNIVQQITRSKNHKYQIRTSVLRPIEFLRSLGISMLDEIPIEDNKFYNFWEE